MSIQSLMQLEECCLSKLEVHAAPYTPGAPKRKNDFIKSERDVSLTFMRESRSHESKRLYWITLGVEASWANDAKARFEMISATIDGVFSFPVGTKQEEIAKYVPVLCLTNLYSFARGAISQATGSCRGGSYLLPLVNMNEVVKLLADTKASQPKAIVRKSGKRKLVSRSPKNKSVSRKKRRTVNK